MCPSSWKLYLDDFPFLGSSLAHLEPKLELFEFWEFGSWWLFVARLYPIYVLFAFKIFLLPVPTRPGTRPFLQVPDPSRPEVKNPYPSDPDHNHILLNFSLLMGCKWDGRLYHIFSTKSRCNTLIFDTLVFLMLLDFSSQGHRVSSRSSPQCGVHP